MWEHGFEDTLGVNFTNILRAAFAPISLRRKITNLNVSTEKLLKTLSYEKAARKLLVKLTIGGILYISAAFRAFDPGVNFTHKAQICWQWHTAFGKKGAIQCHQ